ncbi:MAG: putative bifunctional diguanylate cyclase/phosphodiesterase [Vulcanimicrobiaceae bacterium]
MLGLREPEAIHPRTTAIYVVAFILAWPLANVLAWHIALTPGIGSWSIDAALDVLLFIMLGWRWWPLIVVAIALRLAMGHPPDISLATLIIQPAVSAIGYGFATIWLMRRMRVRFPLAGLRDVGAFCAVLALGAPIVINTVLMLISLLTHELTAQGALAYVRYFVVDAVAIIVLVPVITTFADWNAIWTTLLKRRVSAARELALISVTTIAVVGIAYLIRPVVGTPALELAFVPLAVVAIRFGMGGAIVGIVVTDVTSTALHFAYHTTSNVDNTEYQMFLLASALVALLLGSISAERDALMVQLERRAYVDELTGLPNRERLVEWIERHTDASIILVILDIDDMRLLNEGVGRVNADRVLQELAVRLRTGLPTSYYVARLSADEFAVALVDDRSPHALLAELRAFFDAPFDVEGSRIFLSVSIGAVRMVRFGSADDLLRKADLALHHAKRTPTRGVVYSPDLQAGSAPSLVGELHRAVERNEFVLFFQPIFAYDGAAKAWRVAGAEALLRWAHPERGIVTPDDFIDLLERLAISEPVGWNVVDQSLAQAAIWRATIPEFKVWVNLFGRQAVDRDCSRRIGEAVLGAGLPSDALVVEISERLVASDEREVAALVQSLRRIGVATAIDDFGTGGSSFGRVSDVPAQILKIDRTFVNRSEVDAKAKAVATTIVRLASELGMTVLAEGVENAMQVEAMLDIGCYLAQGYALGHPLPADLFTRTVLDASATTV